MGISKLAYSKQVWGAIVAVVLLTVIFVPFQQATAFTVSVELPGAVGGEITGSVAGEPFEITIDVEAGELISIEEITLILDNGDASVIQAVFDSDGDLIDGNSSLIVNNALEISTFSDTGYAYGFGTVSDGITGFASNTYSFTSTDDFIGGNSGGASNSGVTDFVTGLLGPGTITISGSLRTATLAVGTHTLDVLINTGAGVNPDELTIDPPFEFDVVEDDTIAVQQEQVLVGATGASFTLASDLVEIDYEFEFEFDSVTTTTGDITVVVQSTGDFLDAHTPEELAELGFQESTSLTFLTDDDNTEYNPIGIIADIDLSTLGLPDGTEVTIAVNYDDSGLDADEEEDVRLMHQRSDLSGWDVLTNNDVFINGGEEVDTTANIVYGTTDDFSLFAPAVSSSTGGGGGDDDDGGSGGGGGGGGGGGTVVIQWPPSVTTVLSEEHLENFPLERVQVSNSAFLNAGGVSINQANVGQQLSIEGTFANHGGVSQTYAFIVQITDEDGFVTDISWQQGTLAGGSGTDVSTLWTPDAEGEYTVKIFVWNGISATPVPLSEVAENTILVS